MKHLTPLLLVGPLYLFSLGAPISEAVGAMAAGALILVALGRLITQPELRSLLPREIILALGAYFLAYILATALASPYPSDWRKLLGENWLKLLLLAVPLATYQKTEHVDRAMKILVTTGALVAIYAIGQHFSGIDPFRHRPAPLANGIPMSVGFFGHHLTYGGHVMLLFLAAVVWALFSDPRRKRSLVSLTPWVAVLLLAAALFWSYARSAQIGALVGIVVVSQALPGRRRWAALAGLAAMVSVALATPSFLLRFGAILQAGGETTRRNLWLSSLHGIAARPWLGFGPGNFQHMMEHYKVEGFYDTMAHSHNDFLMHGVNAGLVGIAAAAILLVVTTLFFWRARRGMGSLGWIPVTAVSCQFAITTAGLFQVYQTDDEVEFLLYFVLGAALAVSLRRKPPLEKTLSGKSEKLALPADDL